VALGVELEYWADKVKTSRHKFYLKLAAKYYSMLYMFRPQNMAPLQGASMNVYRVCGD
jgi:hypothetical protein